MKCTLILFFSLVLNLASAQLVVDPDLLLQSDDANETYISLGFQLELQDQDSVWVHWELVKADDVPLEWGGFFYDNNLCYMESSSTNTPNGWLRINRFYKDQPNEWIYNVQPNGIEGTSSITIILYYLDYTTANHTPLDFTDIEYDGDTLSTSSFTIDINIGESVGVYNHAIDHIKIYPNPCNDWILIDDDKEIGLISVYNTTGSQVEKWTHQSGQSHKIDHLEDGLYLVRLANKNGQFLKTIKLFKRE